MSLTKNGVIEKITEETKLSKRKATDSVEAIIEIMKSSLATGDDILISGFGKFCVNEKSKRKGRNPATGKDLMLDARKAVTFKCSGILRDKVNGKKGA